jgi:predicted ester cyclase
MSVKNEHIAAVLTVFALATALQWRSAAAAEAATAPATAAAAPAAAADEPPAAGRWIASSPEAERNIRNFIQSQREGVARNMPNIEKYLAPVFVVETRGDESLQRLLGNEMPGRRVVHREDVNKMGAADFAGVEGHKRTIDEIYGVGDEVIARWHIQAVVKGKLFGLQGKGQTIDIIEVAFVRFDKDGRIIQGWYRIDSADLLRQLDYKVQAPQ